MIVLIVATHWEGEREKWGGREAEVGRAGWKETGCGVERDEVWNGKRRGVEWKETGCGVERDGVWSGMRRGVEWEETGCGMEGDGGWNGK